MRYTKILKRTKFISCFSVLLFTTSRAQQPPDSLMYHIGPVTSIGTRMAEPWIQVPFSISHITQKEFNRGKGYGIDEVLSMIPGVLVQSRFGNQDVRLSIRGFGARGAGERSNAGTSRGVRILNNGFPDTEPDGRTAFDLVDISGAGAVEVVRSNASSVYGNASGGVVNIMSNTMFSSPFASYSEYVGSFAFRKEMVNAGAMLSGGKLYFSLGNTNSDGWRYQSRSTQTLLSTGIVADLDKNTNLGIHITATSNMFRIPGPLSQQQYDSLAQQADSLYIKRDERRFNRLGRLGVTLAHNLDDNNSVSISAFVQPKFLERSERGTFRDFNRYHIGGSAVFANRSSVGSLSNTLLAGVDEAYQDGAILFYTLSYAGGRSLPLRDNKREGANNFGAFFQDEISLDENWLALVGLRYDDITYYSESYINLALHDTKSFTHLTPKAGLTYRVSPTHSFYLNYGGGVEVPAGNETDPIGTFGADTVYVINPLLEPITSQTIEVGTKQIVSLGSDESPGNLTYEVAVYRLQVDNDIIPYRNGRFYFTAGKTERMGLEVAGALNFTFGLSMNASFTASSNKYKTYAVDSVHYGKPGAAADYSNNKMVGVPDLYYTLGLRYAPDELQGAYASVTLQSIGEYFADDANKISVPAYSVVNVGVGVDRLPLGSGIYFVSGFLAVSNLFDRRYIGSVWLNPDIVGGRPVYIEPGLPRNFVASVSLGMNF